MIKRRHDLPINDLFNYAADNNRPTIVYMVTNRKNGKRYIGVTRTSFEQRWRKHVQGAMRGVTTRLARAIVKYGPESFDGKILEHCGTYQSALTKEIELIAKHRPEYNLTKGGQGMLGYRMSQASIKKMSDRKRGKPNYSRLGVKLTSEQVEKIRQKKLEKPTRYWLGKSRSEDTKQKISAAKRGKSNPFRFTEKQAQVTARLVACSKSRQKKVFCATTGQSFASVAEAATAFGTHKASISAVCNRKRNSWNGHVFTYVSASDGN